MLEVCDGDEGRGEAQTCAGADEGAEVPTAREVPVRGGAGQGLDDLRASAFDVPQVCETVESPKGGVEPCGEGINDMILPKNLAPGISHIIQDDADAKMFWNVVGAPFPDVIERYDYGSNHSFYNGHPTHWLICGYFYGHKEASDNGWCVQCLAKSIFTAAQVQANFESNFPGCKYQPFKPADN